MRLLLNSVAVLAVVVIWLVLGTYAYSYWEGDYYYPNPQLVCSGGRCWYVERAPIGRYKWDGTPLTNRDFDRMGIPRPMYNWDGTYQGD